MCQCFASCFHTTISMRGIASQACTASGSCGYFAVRTLQPSFGHSRLCNLPPCSTCVGWPLHVGHSASLPGNFEALWSISLLPCGKHGVGHHIGQICSILADSHI